VTTSRILSPLPILRHLKMKSAFGGRQGLCLHKPLPVILPNFGHLNMKSAFGGSQGLCLHKPHSFILANFASFKNDIGV
jgi:hypothetical protein